MVANSISEEDGAFQEVFLLGVTKKSGSEVQFAAVIENESLGIEQGDKDFEDVPLGNGGRMVKRTPEGPASVTFKIFPLSVDVTDGNDLVQYFLGGSYDATAPIKQVNTRNRDLFRIACLFTDDTAASTASGTTASDYAARRWSCKNMRFVSYKEPYDGVWAAEVTFKAPAYDLTATGTITRESVTSQDGSGLDALGSY